MIWQGKFEKLYLLSGCLLFTLFSYFFNGWQRTDFFLMGCSLILITMSLKIRSNERKFARDYYNDDPPLKKRVANMTVSREMASGALVMVFIAINCAIHDYYFLSALFTFFSAGQYGHHKSLLSNIDNSEWDEHI